MANLRFTEQMQAFGRWKADLIAAIRRYQRWLDKQGMSTEADDLRTEEALELLRADRLNIAFVAEFARGKTELINAIFFSEYDRRLLPSEAGRTTMCPTELFYDSERNAAYIELLPIESRLEDASMSSLKSQPDKWLHTPLDLDSPAHLAEAFRQIVEVKTVTVQEARDLGLYAEELHTDPNSDAVEIPRWRHARISFPNPLLKQGLVILDTPGLNAVGAEPELTLNMLPNAQAVVFVLAADTGVTRSDLEMWRQNVRPLRGDPNRGVVVVLNKIDALWDELKSDAEVQAGIDEQRRKVAEPLGIDESRIYPASAQKGLLAKIRHNEELLGRSNILTLEAVLGADLLKQKRELIRSHVAEGMGSMIRGTRNQLATRLTETRKQLAELRGVNGRNDTVIRHLMSKTREEQVAYHRRVESFQASRKAVLEQSERLTKLLDMGEVDKHLLETRQRMTSAITTVGLRDGMKMLFEQLSTRLNETADFGEQLNGLVGTAYRTFQQDEEEQTLEPVRLEMGRYCQDLEQLQEEAEAFRNSPVTTMTEQSYVIQKFFLSLASHARGIALKAHKEAEGWRKAVLAPLIKQIQEQKSQMEQRLAHLRKISESRETLEGRIAQLEKEQSALQRNLGEVDAILALIERSENTPLEKKPGKPNLYLAKAG